MTDLFTAHQSSRYWKSGKLREISTRILRLTQEGVDDNATVKVITVFTLIYLPASFVAVSLFYPHICA